MADKIDQIIVGSTSYDISVPPDAELNIGSLTTSSFIQTDSLVLIGNSSADVYILSNGTGFTFPSSLSAGSNITFSTGSTYLQINGTDTSTWTAVSGAGSGGYIYRCSGTTYTPSSYAQQWLGEIRITSSVRFRVAHGIQSNLNRATSNTTISFGNSSFFSAAPVVLISFKYDNATWAEYTRVASTSTTGFVFGLTPPSGVSGSGCSIHWIAIQYYSSL